MTQSVSDAGAATLLSASAAGLAGSLLVTTQECKIYGDRSHYPLALHPTQISVAGSEAAGMVVGNLGSCLAFLVLHFVACKLASLLQTCALRTVFRSRGDVPFVEDVQGFMRFPGGPALLFQVLYQGAAVGSLQLAYSPPTVMLNYLGVCALIVCVAVPVYLFRTWVLESAVFGTTVKDPRTAGFGKWKRRVLHFMLGPSEWVSLTKTRMWTLRYSAVIRSYRLGCLWYHFLQYASMFAVAAIQAFTPTSYIACGHIKLASFCVIFIMLVVLVEAKPYARARDVVMDGTVMTFQCVALIFMAVGYYREKPQDLLFQGATVLLLFGVVCLLVKVAVGFVCEVYVMVVCRRDRLQRRYFANAENTLDDSVQQELEVHDVESTVRGTGRRRNTLYRQESLLALTPINTSSPLDAPLFSNLLTPQDSREFSPMLQQLPSSDLSLVGLPPLALTPQVSKRSGRPFVESPHPRIRRRSSTFSQECNFIC